MMGNIIRLSGNQKFCTWHRGGYSVYCL